jgi:hypothetical protein
MLNNDVLGVGVGFHMQIDAFPDIRQQIAACSTPALAVLLRDLIDSEVFLLVAIGGVRYEISFIKIAQMHSPNGLST